MVNVIVRGVAWPPGNCARSWLRPGTGSNKLLPNRFVTPRVLMANMTGGCWPTCARAVTNAFTPAMADEPTNPDGYSRATACDVIPTLKPCVDCWEKQDSASGNWFGCANAALNAGDESMNEIAQELGWLPQSRNAGENKSHKPMGECIFEANGFWYGTS